VSSDDHEHPSAAAFRFDGTHCHIVIERPRAGVVVLTISGRDVGEFGDGPMLDIEKDFKSGEAIELFVDARRVQGASLDVSSDWAQWLGKHRADFHHVSMLTSTRFIQMTADFVRRFAGLGDVMRIYTDPAAFDEAVAVATSHRS
jgi:hypothetical protein